MLTRIFLVILLAVVSHIIAADDGKGADARSTDVSVGCFAGDSLVKLTNGEEKAIGYLNTGDGIMSVNHLKAVPDEMFLMLDKEPSKQGIVALISSFFLKDELIFSDILYI